MDRSRAIILQHHEEAQKIVASSARISTQNGSALEIYDRAGEKEKDLKLISKVLSSGHKSVIEHQFFSIAFNEVSVLVEQFVIEFRLASYTVKSRRYVNFSDAGFVVPDGMANEVKDIYISASKKLFSCYDKLIEAGVAKEDARFVLPYGFRSNFFMTVNARELLLMIDTMLNGRGSRYPELRAIGKQLKEQFETLYPGVIKFSSEEADIAVKPAELTCKGIAAKPAVELFAKPENGPELIERAMRFNSECESCAALLEDNRPRALETLNYSFEIDNVSLACVTHFTRHRMLSLQNRNEVYALKRGNYVLPESIADNKEALSIYEAAFAEQSEAANKAIFAGAKQEELAYFAMAGHTTDIMITMNAREAAHFARLRTCRRAQWEIRRIAIEMVRQLTLTDLGDLFNMYGPTCAMTGKCPEGKMTCGHPIKSLF